MSQREGKQTTGGEKERAFLIAVDTGNEEQLLSVEDSLQELATLAQTAGAEPVGMMTQKLEHPDSATYIGKGKLEELKALEGQLAFDVVVVDDELRPAQQHNLEDQLHARVIDRTELILDIFAQHARTREGLLQVELAQLAYRLPRLSEHAINFSRVGGGTLGGAIGVRGPGETKLEIDRRRIRRRMSEIKRELEAVRQHRQVSRQQRASHALPVVAVIGYTNAGKSTLFNALTDANALVENKLFATLDPTTRQLTLPNNQEALLTDTVGFIQKLPTDLVAAFRATLEEVTDADILLEVVDISHPNMHEQHEEVLRTLKDLHAEHLPRITALNKIDLLGKTPQVDTSFFPDAVAISALQRQGLDTLCEKMSQVLAVNMVPICVTVPYDRGELVDLFHRKGHIEQELHEEEGTLIVGRLPYSLRGQYLPYLCAVPAHVHV
ncbi:GTPase HflX [Ktedonobacter racemifer]|uniref:GTPase HflX n=1 Tax=Ktedonobacter racemifer DSM 44963 TaxID=485913 RepID=D6U4N8_KTERA|nr:GTPase HflX [Ktedonobacter racemifer]EFH81468.1 GTP-binding proten HflX [Ktedonobacter racemifer DSM 44963]